MNESEENERLDRLVKRLEEEASAGGYRLNPDADFTRELVRGLLTNEGRFGYRACPCRLAAGRREEDLDIICPCDYRDADLGAFGACYCSLYVSPRALAAGEKPAPIPDRRRAEKERHDKMTDTRVTKGFSLDAPVWRCKVCGYLCAREDPPENCPICRAERDRFARFI